MRKPMEVTDRAGIEKLGQQNCVTGWTRDQKPRSRAKSDRQLVSASWAAIKDCSKMKALMKLDLVNFSRDSIAAKSAINCRCGFSVRGKLSEKIIQFCRVFLLHSYIIVASWQLVGAFPVKFEGGGHKRPIMGYDRGQIYGKPESTPGYRFFCRFAGPERGALEVLSAFSHFS